MGKCRREQEAGTQELSINLIIQPEYEELDVTIYDKDVNILW